MSYTWEADVCCRTARRLLEEARDELLKAIHPDMDGSHQLDKPKIIEMIAEITRVMER